MEIITSRQNSLFKHIKNLKDDKKYRREQGEFWVDGVNFVAQAEAKNWKIKKLVYVPEVLNTPFKTETLDKISAENRVAFSADLYSALSTKKDIQGIGAIIEEKALKNTLPEGRIVVLENISNPGNLGTIMRTSVAFGIKNIVIINPAVDPFSFEVVRASMGSIFYLNVSVFNSTDLLGKQLVEKGIISVGTSLQDDSVDIRTFDLKSKSKLAIWFGNEAKGLTPEARKICQGLLHIPMTKDVDSLNISESVGITLWEVCKNNI